jgi:hypothetical protein
VDEYSAPDVREVRQVGDVVRRDVHVHFLDGHAVMTADFPRVTFRLRDDEVDMIVGGIVALTVAAKFVERSQPDLMAELRAATVAP